MTNEEAHEKANARCETCKHWKQSPIPASLHSGQCTKIVGYAASPHDWKAYVDKDDPRDGGLVTEHDFGCTLWEKKE